MTSRPNRIVFSLPAMCVVAASLLSISGISLAQDAEKMSAANLFAAKLSGDAYRVSVSNAPYIAQSMRVTGPSGFVAESKSLVVSSSKPMPDGLYNYEITGALPATDVVFDAESNRANGRSENARPTQQPVGVIASGYFRIVNGGIFEPGDATEEASSGPQPIELQERDELTDRALRQ